MRKTLFFLFFLLLVETSFAANAKPPRRWVYKERAGVGHVMAKVGGAFAGLLLGPLGYFGIRLCTHDEDTRYYAGRGFKLWGFFACIAVVSLLAYWTKSNPGSMDFLQAWLQDAN